MTSALQNRLVGTVILVALAVIFLPDFLDRKKESSTDTFVSVPATPAKKPIVDPEPFPSQRAANLSQRPIDTVEEPVVDDSVPVVPKPMVKEVTSKPEDDLASQTVVSKPATESDDGGWVVQLGSFRHEKNVKQLLDKLEKAGYRAFSRPIETRFRSFDKSLCWA